MSLQLPTIQYGDWGSVGRRMQQVVSDLVRGAPLHERMTCDGLIDPTQYTGLLVMGGSLVDPEPHFHCTMPWKVAGDALFKLRVDPATPSPVEDRMFEASLDTAWGVLGLLSEDSQWWLLPPYRHEPFLHAALAMWSELDALGHRYYTAVQGKSLWAVPNNLHYVLANMGVPADVLCAPLPPNGPRALLRYACPAN